MKQKQYIILSQDNLKLIFSRDNLKAFRKLIDNQIYTIELFDHPEYSLAHYATYCNAPKCLNYLILNDKVDLLNSSSDNKMSLIKLAVDQAKAQGKTGCLKVLYKHNLVDLSEYKLLPSVYNTRGETPLMKAAQQGNLNLVKFLTKVDPKAINMTTIADRYHYNDWLVDLTALHYACQGGHLEIVQYLLDSGADIAARTKHLDTVFHLAVYSGSVALMEILKAEGADPNWLDADKDPAIGWAVELNQLDIFQWFLEQGVSFDYLNQNGYSAIHFAAARGCIEMLIFFKIHFENYFNELLTVQEKIAGDTPLLLAAKRGYTKIIEWLLEHGASLTQENNKGMTALLCSAENGHLETIQSLLNHGASFGEKDGAGNGLLIHASMGGHLKLVQWLMAEQRCTLAHQARSHDGATAFHLASMRNHRHILEEFLLKHKVKIDFVDGMGCSALFYAAAEGCIEMMEWLVGKGIQINQKAHGDGQATAVHFASKNGHTEAIKWLVKKGADINAARTDNGYTPLHTAIVSKKIETAYEIIRLDAKINVTVEGNKTALHLAAQYGNLELIKLLKERGIHLFTRDSRNLTASAYAIYGKNLDILKFFIESDPEPITNNSHTGGIFNNILRAFYDPNPWLPPTKNSPETNLFHMAIEEGCLDIAKYLLSKYPSFNLTTPDKAGNLPIHIAYQKGHREILDYLLENGVDILSRNTDGRTILHMPVENNNLAPVKYLVSEKEFPLEILDNNGHTPLHTAAKDCDDSMVSCLIELGANIEARGRNQETPLHMAVTSPQTNVQKKVATIKALIEKNADPYCVNKHFSGATAVEISNQSPLDYIVSQIAQGKHENINILKILIEASGQKTIEMTEKKLMRALIFCLKTFPNVGESREAEKKIIDAVVGYLIGENLNQLGTAQNSNKYIAHLRSFRGEAFSPDNNQMSQLTGWLQETYLALHIRFLFRLMVGVSLNVGNHQAVNIKTNQRFLNTFERQDYVVNAIKKELLHNIEMWRIRKLISKIPINTTDKDSIYTEVAKNILNKIKELPNGQEYSIASRWIGHAIYVNFMHTGDYLLIRIDNLGAGCAQTIERNNSIEYMHPRANATAINSLPTIYPCLLGRIHWNDLEKNNLLRYIKQLLQTDNEQASSAILKVYNLTANGIKFLNNNQLLNLEPVPADFITMQPMLIQTVGNCVVENFKYGQKIRLTSDPMLYQWICEKEQAHTTENEWWQKTNNGETADKAYRWWEDYYSPHILTIEYKGTISCKLKLSLNNNMAASQLNILSKQAKALQRLYQNQQRIVIIGDYPRSTELENQFCVGRPLLAGYIQEFWIKNPEFKWIFYLDLKHLNNTNYPIREDYTPYKLEEVLQREAHFYGVVPAPGESTTNLWFFWHVWKQKEVLLLLDNYHKAIIHIADQHDNLRALFQTLVAYPNCIFFSPTEIQVPDSQKTSLNTLCGSESLCTSLFTERAYYSIGKKITALLDPQDQKALALTGKSTLNFFKSVSDENSSSKINLNTFLQNERSKKQWIRNENPLTNKVKQERENYCSTLEALSSYLTESGKFDEIPNTMEDTWATSEGIMQVLNFYLGDAAHIIDPELGSTNSLFDPNNEEALENYGATIQSILQKDGGQLKKPIVMILNTHPGSRNSIGGKHWVTCVILPKKYSILGETIQKSSETVFYINSLPQQSYHELPLSFKSMLLEDSTFKGLRDPSDEELRKNPQQKKLPYTKHIPAAFNNNVKFINLTGTLQQTDGSSCGWWAVYNALMIVLTGNDLYATQTGYRSPYKLRTLFPKLDIETKKQSKSDEATSTETIGGNPSGAQKMKNSPR